MGNTQKYEKYNLQIIHDAEKECTAIKGWHSKISSVQNRPPPTDTHMNKCDCNTKHVSANAWNKINNSAKDAVKTQTPRKGLHTKTSRVQNRHTHSLTHTHICTHTTHYYTHKWTGVAVTIWQNWARKLK